MAINLTGTSASFTGTGISSVYSPGFYVNSSDQVKVYVAGVLQSIGDNYTVNNVGVSTGCTVVANFPLGSAVYIERQTPITQLVDTRNNETILEDVLDAEFDKLTMIAQEITQKVDDRALLAPKGELIADIPAKAARLGKALAFDAVTGAPVAVDTPAAALAGALAAEAGALAAKVAAESARDATLTAYDQFDDRYLGPKAANPALDNDGNALVGGALYYNTVAQEMRIWTGTAWVAAYVSGTGFVAKAGDTMTGLLILAAAIVGAASLRVPPGTAPSAPSNGDVWSTAAGFFVCVAGVTYQIATLTGAQRLSGKTLVSPIFEGTAIEDAFAITDGAAFEIDPANGSLQKITLGANRTPKATNFQNNQSITLAVDDGTAFTLTWTDATFGGTGVKWLGGAPTLGATGWNWITLWKMDGQVYGQFGGNSG